MAEAPAAGRRFYRLVRDEPAVRDDFVPQGQVPGYRPPSRASASLARAIMHGVSVFDTEVAAREQNAIFATRRGGSPFRFVGVLDIPDDSPILCDDEFGNDHHWDLYATPDELLRYVTPPLLPL